MMIIQPLERTGHANGGLPGATAISREPAAELCRSSAAAGILDRLQMNAISCPHCGIAMCQLRADGRCAACGQLLPEDLRATPAIAVQQPPAVLPPLPWHNWEAVIRQCQACRELLFPIRSDPWHGFCAGFLPDGHQVLVGWIEDGKMAMVIFDRVGNLIGVVHLDLPTPGELLEAGYSAAVDEDNCEDYLSRELNVSPGVIRIRAFCLPEEEIAVYELPDCLQDLQENPSNPSLSENERHELQEFFQVWKDRGQFVLVWQNDYWLDCNGEVVAT
jgi:hypothetical protein